MPLGYGDADGFVLYNDKGYYILKPGGMALLTARMGQDYAQTYHFNPLGHLWGWVVVLILSGFAAHSTHRRRARISEVAADSHGHDTALAAIARSAAQRDARPVTRDIASARAPLPTRGFGRKGTTPDR